MIRLLRRLVRRPSQDMAQTEAALDFLRTPPAAMAPIKPPEPVNDDLMRYVYAEVARELRVAGYLR